MSKADKIDYLLQHITSLLTRYSDQILQEQLGIGYSQYKLLRVIGKGLPVKQRYISETLGQTEASISRQIDLLLVKDLIAKTTDPNNKRVHMIGITLKGAKLNEAAVVVLNKYHNRIFESSNDKQKSSILDSLQSLHDLICKYEHSPGSEYLNYLINN